MKKRTASFRCSFFNLSFFSHCFENNINHIVDIFVAFDKGFKRFFLVTFFCWCCEAIQVFSNLNKNLQWITCCYVCFDLHDVDEALFVKKFSFFVKKRTNEICFCDSIAISVFFDVVIDVRNCRIIFWKWIELWVLSKIQHQLDHNWKC